MNEALQNSTGQEPYPSLERPDSYYDTQRQLEASQVTTEGGGFVDTVDGKLTPSQDSQPKYESSDNLVPPNLPPNKHDSYNTEQPNLVDSNYTNNVLPEIDKNYQLDEHKVLPSFDNKLDNK